VGGLTPVDTLTEYVRAFETLDPAAVLPYYNVPCMFITRGGVSEVADAAVAHTLATDLVAKAHQYGYKRTEFLGPVDCKMLSPTVAVLRVRFRRLNSADRVILDLGFMYVMHKGDEGWKIAVVTAYEHTPRA